MKNTYQELTLTNGEVVKLTLNFARLLKLKNDRKDLYERLMKILQSKDFDIIFDSMTVLYVGYLCANVEHLQDEQILSEEEFMELVEFDLGEIIIVAGNLIQSKKK